MVRDENEVEVKAVLARNIDKYDPGQEIALGAREAVVSGGGTSVGQDDAEEVSYSVSGIGYIREDKSEPA